MIISRFANNLQLVLLILLSAKLKLFYWRLDTHLSLIIMGIIINTTYLLRGRLKPLLMSLFLIYNLETIFFTIKVCLIWSCAGIFYLAFVFTILKHFLCVKLKPITIWVPGTQQLHERYKSHQLFITWFSEKF